MSHLSQTNKAGLCEHMKKGPPLLRRASIGSRGSESLLEAA
jgi:hypothetical protein